MSHIFAFTLLLYIMFGRKTKKLLSQMHSLENRICVLEWYEHNRQEEIAQKEFDKDFKELIEETWVELTIDENMNRYIKKWGEILKYFSSNICGFLFKECYPVKDKTIYEWLLERQTLLKCIPNIKNEAKSDIGNKNKKKSKK